MIQHVLSYGWSKLSMLFRKSRLEVFPIWRGSLSLTYTFKILHFYFQIGVIKIQQWLRESLERRLHKSLACDWMPIHNVHQFPLRQFYVQLEWERKVHLALRTERVTLTSIHDLIQQMTKAEGTEKQTTTSRIKESDRMTSKSVLIEGKGC